MIHASGKYDGVQDANGVVPEDEPVFLLRASDPIAVKAVQHWVFLSMQAGEHQEKMEAVHDHIGKMKEYRKESP